MSGDLAWDVKDAVISDDGMYRYRLSRGTCLRNPLQGSGRVCFVMLNPSTADAYEDDPTVRRCIGFARSWGSECLDIVNLFSYRATEPSDLVEAHRAGVDICGEYNPKWIRLSMLASGFVVAAWGANVERLPEHPDIAQMCRDANRDLYRIGAPTKAGHPRHPLYLPGDAPLIQMGCGG